MEEKCRIVFSSESLAEINPNERDPMQRRKYVGRGDRNVCGCYIDLKVDFDIQPLYLCPAKAMLYHPEWEMTLQEQRYPSVDRNAMKVSSQVGTILSHYIVLYPHPIPLWSRGHLVFW